MIDDGPQICMCGHRLDEHTRNAGSCSCPGCLCPRFLKYKAPASPTPDQLTSK